MPFSACPYRLYVLMRIDDLEREIILFLNFLSDDGYPALGNDNLVGWNIPAFKFDNAVGFLEEWGVWVSLTKLEDW